MTHFYCPICTGVCMVDNPGDHSFTGTCENCHLTFSVGYSPAEAPFEPNVDAVVTAGFIIGPDK